MAERHFSVELYHHGIKGQKWGVRRFQNRNGSYTKAGQRRRERNIRINKKIDDWDERVTKTIDSMDRKEKAFNKEVKRINDQVGLGKTFTLTVLGGWYGRESYSTLRAAGHSDAVATGIVAANGILGSIAGKHIGSNIAMKGHPVLGNIARFGAREYTQKVMRDYYSVGAQRDRLKRKY